MRLSFDMGRNESAFEQPFSLECVLFGAFALRVQVGNRHEAPPPSAKSMEDRGPERIREVADRQRGSLGRVGESETQIAASALTRFGGSSRGEDLGIFGVEFFLCEHQALDEFGKLGTLKDRAYALDDQPTC